MAVTTARLAIVNILEEGAMKRASAEEMATMLAQHFEQAASEDELRQQLAIERERSDAKFEALQAQIDARFAQMQERMDARFAQFEVKVYRAVGAGTALLLAAISIWAAFG